MSQKEGIILAVDDNEDILTALRLLVKQHVQTIHTISDPERIPNLMSEFNFDVILLDMNFSMDVISGQEGFHWLRKILEIDPNAVVIFITAYGDVEKAVKAVKAGAMDFVIKPWQNEKLLATISSGIRLRKSRTETANLKMKQRELSATLDQPFHEFIGNSTPMQNVLSLIQKVAQTDASVLILGENGTGKELVARALHRNSSRADDVFISVDLGALSETLFESELFGHVKGAFTDAKKDRPGRLEIASGGTLFLDEIGNLSLPLQAKLLTSLEKREVIRVGSNRPQPIDIRLICATNMPIHKMAKENRFRQDLLYRINTVEIFLPPLRERPEDIKPLAEFFLENFSKKYKKDIKGISLEALRKMENYSWPGNVRELQHAVERTVIMSDNKILQPEDFLLCTSDVKTEDFEFDNLNLEEVELNIIRKVLNKHRGNITQAARELGLTRTSLYRRLEKYGL
ncbi:MAG: sigma-54-dependent Fis family transcriptional regulator [Candidatus Cloacimonetes bacterium]|nr:sigma-54-dependent Fis family transcriptional regulator [Candidatus Cloacimonadota bacterium]